MDLFFFLLHKEVEVGNNPYCYVDRYFFSLNRNQSILHIRNTYMKTGTTANFSGVIISKLLSYL